MNGAARGFEPNPDHDSGKYLTATGRIVNPLRLTAEDVTLADIANSLAMKCRWAGFCREFYSIAQHCVLVSEAVVGLRGGNLYDARHALLHDAAEAYLFDAPSPVKPSLWVEDLVQCRAGELVPFHSTEQRILTLIFKAFGIAGRMSAHLEEIDVRIRADEARDLMPRRPDWNLDHALGIAIEPWEPKEARRRFLERAAMLGLSAGEAKP